MVELHGRRLKKVRSELREVAAHAPQPAALRRTCSSDECTSPGGRELQSPKGQKPRLWVQIYHIGEIWYAVPVFLVHLVLEASVASPLSSSQKATGKP